MKVQLTYKDPDYAIEVDGELTEEQRERLYEVGPGEYITLEVDLDTGDVRFVDERTG